jgi:hypothetical protein
MSKCFIIIIIKKMVEKLNFPFFFGITRIAFKYLLKLLLLS